MKKPNVYHCFLHILIFSRIFGLLKLGRLRFLKSNRLCVIFRNTWVFLAMVFYTTVFAKSVDFKKDNNELTNWLNNAIDYMKIILLAAMLISMVGMTPFRKVDFIDLLKLLRDIDDELKILSVTIPHDRLKTKMNLYFYSSLCIVTAFLGLSHYLDGSDNIFSNIAQMSSLFIQMITEMQFVLYVVQIEYRLHSLNKWLFDYHTSGRFSNDTYWVTPVGAMSSHLSVVSRIHDKLCMAAKKAENMYAFRMLLIISLCFIIMTLKIYYCFSSLYKKRETNIILSSMASVVFDMSLILTMVTACSAAENECYRTAEILHRLERSQRSDSKDKSDVTLFSLQILHGRINFTACGLFPLNFSLMQSIMGAVTTYLIIIVQFDISGQNKLINSPLVNKTK